MPALMPVFFSSIRRHTRLVSDWSSDVCSSDLRCAGATAVHRRFFDPTHWRIIIFDQRGAGRSTPLGEVQDNTPDHLASDIELLRQELRIDEWLLFGGSWGSTIALHYAETHSDRGSGRIRRGSFLCRRGAGEWVLEGARTACAGAWGAL